MSFFFDMVLCPIPQLDNDGPHQRFRRWLRKNLGNIVINSTDNILKIDPRVRLAELEANQIAYFMQSEANALRKAVDIVISRIENSLIERILLSRIRTALASQDSVEATTSLLLKTRSSYENGSMETLPSFVPQSFRSSISNEIPKPGKSEQRKPAASNCPLILYVAGGGFIVPTSRRQKLMVQQLAEHTNSQVMLAQHRLAPEHPFPSAPEDVATQYQTLLAGGVDAKDVFIGADTAGASVALGAIQLLYRMDNPLPAGIVLFSPWCDLGLTGWSYITSSITTKSPFRMETAAFCARLYLQETPASDPLASPIHANLSGWPPILIHTSEHDLHFDDAIRMAENGKSQGCDVRLNYWNSPRHHLERLSNKDAKKSFAEVSRFIERNWKTSP